MSIFPSFNWQELKQCAGLVGLSSDRIKKLEDRVVQVENRDGAPYVLVLGQKHGALELLLSHWLNPSVSDALAAAAETPLVLSEPTATLKDIVGTWPSCPQTIFRNQCYFAAQSLGPLSSFSLGQLRQLTLFDLCILVVRLGQPLTRQDLQMAESMVGLAATIKVLMVGLPSENVSANEIAELVAYSKAQLSKLGFHAQQIKESAVWYIDGKSRFGSIGDLPSFLASAQATHSRVQWSPLYQDLKSIVEDGLQRSQVQAKDVAISATIPNEEVDRLAAELQMFLIDAIDKLRETLPLRCDDEHPGKSIANIMSGWNAGACIEGFWVRYVEELRPGTHAGLVNFSESAFETIVSIRRHDSSQLRPNSTLERLFVRIEQWPVRLGIATLAGLIAAGSSVLFPISDPLRLLLGLLFASAVYAYSPLLFQFLSQQAFTNKLTAIRSVELLGWETFVAAVVREFKSSLICNKLTTIDRWQNLYDNFRKLVSHHFTETNDEL